MKKHEHTYICHEDNGSREEYIYKKDSFIQFLYGEGDRTITKIDLVADPRIDYLIYDKKLPPRSLVAGLQ